MFLRNVGMHGVTTQKINIDIFTALNTSDFSEFTKFLRKLILGCFTQICRPVPISVKIG
jgi:hypothetical protein